MEEKNKLFTEFPPVTTAEWEAQIQVDLKGADYEKKLIWNTVEGIPVKPYYREENTKQQDTLPGIHGNWEIRQDIFSEDIAEINAIARDITQKGTEGLGLDCRAVKTASDLEALLDGIDLNRIAIHFKNCSDYQGLLSNFLHYIQTKGFTPASIRGSLGYCPLDTLLTGGKLEISEDQLVREAGALLQMAKSLPDFKIITIGGNLFHEAGSTATQELGYTLAMAHEYLYLLHKTADVADVANAIQPGLSAGSNYFMEIAKFRAIRLLWSQLTGEYGLKECKLNLLARSSRWNKTLFDPYVNMLRTTTEAMSAAIGGANVIQVDPFDAVYRKPDAFSMRMARNQQIILKEESWLNKVIDPSAGSYYIENLTLLIAEKSWETFREIEKEGGFCKANANGSVRDKIELIAKQRLKDIATRKTIVLGTNQYPNTLEKSEISHEPVSGVTQEVSSEGLRFLRLSEEFEIMRRDTEKFEQKNGEPVKIFLLTIGNPAMRKARAMFATNFFGCAGFSVIDNNGFPTIEEGFKAWKTSAAEILVLCSSDEEYAGFVPELCGLVKAELPGPLIIVAGFPKDQIEEFKALGVDDFIHIRSNVLETLTQYQVKLGIK